MLSGHPMHALPSIVYVPSGQFLHTTAPASLECIPRLHFTHSSAVPDLYVPDGHSCGSACSVEITPAIINMIDTFMCQARGATCTVFVYRG